MTELIDMITSNMYFEKALYKGYKVEFGLSNNSIHFTKGTKSNLDSVTTPLKWRLQTLATTGRSAVSDWKTATRLLLWHCMIYMSV